MKILLTIMLVFSLKGVWTSFKNIFRTRKSVSKEADELCKKLENSSADEKGMATVLGWIVAIGILLYKFIFYITSAIYVGNIVFVLLSALLIVRSTGQTWKAIKWLANTNDGELLRKSTLGLWGRIFNALHIGYIAYFAYFLITTW